MRHDQPINVQHDHKKRSSMTGQRWIFWPNKEFPRFWKKLWRNKLWLPKNSHYFRTFIRNFPVFRATFFGLICLNFPMKSPKISIFQFLVNMVFGKTGKSHNLRKRSGEEIRIYGQNIPLLYTLGEIISTYHTDDDRCWSSCRQY